MTDTVVVRDLSNREFLARHAGPGRIGLSGGTTLLDRAICRAERLQRPDGRWGVWTHAFLFEGLRADGHQWVIESDLQVKTKHINLGVQENRVAKYEDEAYYGSLAVLDFGLAAGQVDAIVRAGLDLVASHEAYSIRELLGTLLALRHADLRGRPNLLARDRSVYCSAFVRHVFRAAGIDLAPGVELKNTTPEDIATTPVPHTKYLLVREVPKSLVETAARRVRVGVRSGARRLRGGAPRRREG